ncbi:MAG: hypothetical protein H6686_12210 [Fibrobacteria bacterium]|nr:hypothetical protein [Fibrobacteria bacterium]
MVCRQRFFAFCMLVLLGLFPSACDSSKSSTQAGDEPLRTNFAVNLAKLVAAEGEPDSLVAAVVVDGIPIDTVRPDLRARKGDLVRFPVDVAEGSKIEVSYRIYKDGGVVAAGAKAWISGEAPLVPSPNLAPKVRIDTVLASVPSDSMVLVRRDSPYWVRLSSSDDVEAGVVALLVDWDGDGRFDDSLVPPKRLDSLQITWSNPGTYHLWALVRDESGLERSQSIQVRVLSKASIMTSPDDTVTLNDSVEVFAEIEFDDSLQRESTRLEWSVEGDVASTGPTASRKYAWSTPGTRNLVVRSLDDLGEAARRSVQVVVLKDEPQLAIHGPQAVDRGALAVFRFEVRQRVDSVVAWGMDFDGDTSGGQWDTVGTGRLDSLRHVFAQAGDHRVMAWVQDEDGNRGVASTSLIVQSSSVGALVRSTAGTSTPVLSIGDSAALRFEFRFPDENSFAASSVTWVFDGGEPTTKHLDSVARFAWAEPGFHVVRWTVHTPWGALPTDSLRIEVKGDPPVLDLSGLPGVVPRNQLVVLHPGLSDSFGNIVRWGVSFDGDTTTGGWDWIGTGAKDSARHIWSESGTIEPLFFALDDDGNRTLARRSMIVEDRGAAVLALLPGLPPVVSIGDEARLRFAPVVDWDLRTGSRVEWAVDDAPVESLAVDTVRVFRWMQPGSHVVRWRLVGPSGSTSRDSIRVEVVQGVPVIREISANLSGVNTDITFTPVIDPVFGSIVQTRWDFDADGKWDVTNSSGKQSGVWKFVVDSTVSIRLQATDDDGNVADTSFEFSPSNSNPVFMSLHFQPSTVGMSLVSALAATFSDPDGATDLKELSIDWDGDGQWDTAVQVGTILGTQVAHAWPMPGVWNVVARLADRSGGFVLDTVAFTVTADPPEITSIESDRASYRLRDPILLTVHAVDPSKVADLDRLRWDFGGDGTYDTSLSLLGAGGVASEMTWSSSIPGSHKVCAEVRDLAGNVVQSCTTVVVEASPPKVFGRLSDTVLTATETGIVLFDSIPTPSVSGVPSRLVEVWSMPKGGAWTKWTPKELQDSQKTFSVPADVSDWYMVLKAVQDNGEVGFDTLRARILDVFVDARDGAKYPVLEIGGRHWLGRDLHWVPDVVASKHVQSTCGRSDPACEDFGMEYSAPVMIPGRNVWDLDSQVVQSVCPEGWHVPNRREWLQLQSALEGMNPGVPWAISLRDRQSWQIPQPGQVAPGDFRAISENGSANFWASAIPSEHRNGDPFDQQFSLVAVNNTPNSEGSFGGLGGYFTAHGRIRCIATDSVKLGTSSGYHDAIPAQLGQAFPFVVHGIPMNSSPVSIEVRSADGISSKALDAVNFAGDDGSTGQAAVVYSPIVSTPGLQQVWVTARQGGTSDRDSFWINPAGVLNDTRDGQTYPFIHWAGLRWMAKDLNYDTAGIKLAVDALFEDQSVSPPKGTLYPKDLVFAGQSPSSHGSPGPRGICPDGWRLPSSADWNALIQEASVRGLDPTAIFRARSPVEADPNVQWPWDAPGTNISAFKAFQTGYYENTDYIAATADATMYWAGDLGEDPANVSRAQFQLDVDYAPFAADGPASMIVAVRCVSEEP